MKSFFAGNGAFPWWISGLSLFISFFSTGVFTNDLYKRLFPESSEKHLNVARYSTTVFGIFTIIVALLVPVMGGIVDAVGSIGTLTGALLFLPPLWCLFSKKQTRKSVLAVAIVCLVINFFFKFISPLFELSLASGVEMMVGVGVPIVIMAVYEMLLFSFRKRSCAYDNYEEAFIEKNGSNDENATETDADNQHGQRVIALGILMIGILTLVNRCRFYSADLGRTYRVNFSFDR